MAYVLARYLQSTLYGVEAHDLATFAGASTVLVIVAAVAGTYRLVGPRFDMTSSKAYDDSGSLSLREIAHGRSGKCDRQAGHVGKISSSLAAYANHGSVGSHLGTDSTLIGCRSDYNKTWQLVNTAELEPEAASSHLYKPRMRIIPHAAILGMTCVLALYGQESPPPQPPLEQSAIQQAPPPQEGSAGQPAQPKPADGASPATGTGVQ